MRSSIYLRKLRFHAYHGVLPQEQTVGNDYEMDVEIGYDFTHALRTDDLADTISYADVYLVVAEEMKKPSRLLEHVVGRIARRLLAGYPQIETLDLSLTKLNPPFGADCEGAGVAVHLKNDKTI